MPPLVEILPIIGYIGIAGIVFAESGLLIGFFMPGDSLLFTAGFLASQGGFNITILTVIAFVCAVSGDSAGYWLGRKFGRRIFNRPDSWIFRAEHLSAAEKFYAERGGQTIVLARFIPMVRAFMPIIAGIGKMPYGRFMFYNVFGGLIWGVGMSLLGYFLGSSIPGADRYLLPIVLAVIIISYLPFLFHLIKNPEESRKLKIFLQKSWQRFIHKKNIG